jgi:hypothetical protein
MVRCCTLDPVHFLRRGLELRQGHARRRYASWVLERSGNGCFSLNDERVCDLWLQDVCGK